MLWTHNIAWHKFCSFFLNIVKSRKGVETWNCSNSSFPINFMTDCTTAWYNSVSLRNSFFFNLWFSYFNFLFVFSSWLWFLPFFSAWLISFLYLYILLFLQCCFLVISLSFLCYLISFFRSVFFASGFHYCFMIFLAVLSCFQFHVLMYLLFNTLVFVLL